MNWTQWSSWLRKKLGFAPEPNERLDAYYAMLWARAAGIKAPVPADANWSKLQSLLAVAVADRTWNAAYEIEDLLILAFDAGSLPTVFASLTTEAKGVLPDALVADRKAQFSAPDADKRIVLKALAEDLHEHWADTDEKLGYYSYITEKTARALVIALAAFCLSLLLARHHLETRPLAPETSKDRAAAKQQESDSPKAGTAAKTDGGGVPAPIPAVPGKSPSSTVATTGGQPRPQLAPGAQIFPSLSSRRLLLIVLASGTFGAALSMLISLQSRLDSATLPDLEKMAPGVNRLARVIVGAGAAVVLFALVLGGLLEGKALPNLSGPLDAVNLAHLVVLCVAAGFSEKAVPTRLTNIAGA